MNKPPKSKRLVNDDLRKELQRVDKLKSLQNNYRKKINCNLILVCLKIDKLKKTKIKFIKEE